MKKDRNSKSAWGLRRLPGEKQCCAGLVQLAWRSWRGTVHGGKCLLLLSGNKAANGIDVSLFWLASFNLGVPVKEQQPPVAAFAASQPKGLPAPPGLC